MGTRDMQGPWEPGPCLNGTQLLNSRKDNSSNILPHGQMTEHVWHLTTTAYLITMNTDCSGMLRLYWGRIGHILLGPLQIWLVDSINIIQMHQSKCIHILTIVLNQSMGCGRMLFGAFCLLPNLHPLLFQNGIWRDEKGMLKMATG